MTRRSMLVAALLVLAAGLARAHDGHAHTIMGTVSGRQATHMQVKTADGKNVDISLNEKTIVLRGTQKLSIADVAEGQRVVVDVGNGKAPLVARQIKLGPKKL